jgi:hypothetical protein
MQQGGKRAYALQFACQAADKRIERRSAPDWRDCLSVSKIVFAAEFSRWQQRNSALEVRTAIPIVAMHYCDAV